MKNPSLPIEIPQVVFSDLEALVRDRMREVVDVILGEEIDAALGVGSYERGKERCGYRHGKKPARRVTTSLGPVEIEQPRARIQTVGGEVEFLSRLLERYQRRIASACSSLSCVLGSWSRVDTRA